MTTKVVNMRRKARTRLPVAILAVVITTLSASPTLASPASVAELRYQLTSDLPWATVRFDSNGDHFFLCDLDADNRSVAVEFIWDRVAHNGQREFDRRWNWWGPNKYHGCKDIDIDAVEDSLVEFRVCIGVNGSPGGEPAEVTTCAGFWSGAFA